MPDKNLAFNGHYRAVELWRQETAKAWGIAILNEVNASQMVKLREQYRAAGLSAPSYTAIVIKAISRAIAEMKSENPTLNAYLKNFLGFRSIHCFDSISCGFSKAATVDGVDIVIPGHISAPQEITLSEITNQLKEKSASDQAALKDVVTFYRLPGILQRLALWVGAYFPKLREKTRGTFSFTSVGHLGVDWHSLPQSGALQFGMGVLRDRVFAVNGKAMVAPGFDMMCSFDRRFMSGKPPAILMGRVREILESPLLLEEEKSGARIVESQNIWDESHAIAENPRAETTRAKT